MKADEVKQLKEEHRLFRELESKKHVLEVQLFGPIFSVGHRDTGDKIKEIAHKLNDAGYEMRTIVDFWQSL